MKAYKFYMPLEENFKPVTIESSNYQEARKEFKNYLNEIEYKFKNKRHACMALVLTINN